MIERNVFLDQGDTFSTTFAAPGITEQDQVVAELRRWEGNGPLQATFDYLIDEVSETVTISLDAETTAELVRSGYYDVKVVNGLSTSGVARGFAKFRPAVSRLPASLRHVRWGQLRFAHVTWRQLRRKKWSQL